jgi:hypothetical protein
MRRLLFWWLCLRDLLNNDLYFQQILKGQEHSKGEVATLVFYSLVFHSVFLQRQTVLMSPQS